MLRKPRIGLPMRLESETNRFYLGRDYSEALEGLGAIPVNIPLIPNEDYIREILSDLDGVLLPGSDTDVDSLKYGEEPLPKLGRVIFEKEETDLLILAEAEQKNIPIFGICFGMQILNVFRGGSLIQDIESQVPNSLKHQQGKPLARNSHSIDITEDSLLSRLITKKAGVLVNSHHHQAIRNIGKNLVATAKAKDGVIECIEDTRRGKFVVGVQWHPELSWKTDELSRNLFVKFIESCRK
jgi:putative glutamine amidotransferase